MALVFSLFCFFISLIFIFKLRIGKRSQTNINTNHLPSPPKLPIIGNLHQLGALPHRSLHSLSQKYGPLMLLHLGQAPTLVVSSAEMAEEIMKVHDLTFANRPLMTASNQFFYGGGDIVFASYGEYWRQMKKLCMLELLSVKRVNAFRSVREEEVGLLMERISSQLNGGGDVKLTELLLSLSSGIVTRVAFGKKYEGERDGKNGFAQLVVELNTVLGAFFAGDYFPSLAWVDVLTGADARLRRNFQALDAFLDQVIGDHLSKKRMGSNDDLKQRDLVDILLSMQEDANLGTHLSSNNLKGIILDMFSAGTDTTAIALEWAMSELVRHPLVMEKAQEEVRQVVGKDSKIEEHHLHDMNYLKLVIKETLRLHPVGPLLVPREASEDVLIKGYHIPAKTRVYVNAWAIARDPKSWENANEFLPERFDDTPIEFKGQNFHLIPFGAGRRICPGISFAMATVELALANLLCWFDWNLPEGVTTENLDMTEAFGITVHKEKPLHLVPVPRLS